MRNGRAVDWENPLLGHGQQSPCYDWDPIRALRALEERVALARKLEAQASESGRTVEIT
jgi:hypothetical protein